jgi:hypothetical protein
MIEVTRFRGAGELNWCAVADGRVRGIAAVRRAGFNSFRAVPDTGAIEHAGVDVMIGGSLLARSQKAEQKNKSNYST